VAEQPAVEERAAERMIMDYPVETTPATTNEIVKGPEGMKPPER